MKTYSFDGAEMELYIHSLELVMNSERKQERVARVKDTKIMTRVALGLCFPGARAQIIQIKRETDLLTCV